VFVPRSFGGLRTVPSDVEGRRDEQPRQERRTAAGPAFPAGSDGALAQDDDAAAPEASLTRMLFHVVLFRPRPDLTVADRAYLEHPAHQALGARFMQLLEASAIFDYQMQDGEELRVLAQTE